MEGKEKNGAPPERFLFSRVEAAQALGLSPRTVDILIANRRLKATRVRRRVLIRRTELERLAERGA